MEANGISLVVLKVFKKNDILKDDTAMPFFFIEPSSVSQDKKKVVPLKTVDNEVGGLSRVLWTRLLERQVATELYKLFYNI